MIPMYMRLFQVKIKPENFSEFRRFYDERLIPSLQKMPGCLFASLIQSEHPKDEFISMTLWKTQSNAESFVRGSVFQELLQEARPYFADSSEWKIQLSKDLTLEYEPVPTEPVVKSYTASAEFNDTGTPPVKPSLMYLRIVAAKIRHGMMEEARRLYKEIALPALHAVKGCRYAALTEGTEEANEVLFITIWDSKQDAENYEASGLYDSLKEKFAHLFSDLYQWRLALERDYGEDVATSEDLKVSTYNIVTGKSF